MIVCRDTWYVKAVITHDESSRIVMACRVLARNDEEARQVFRNRFSPGMRYEFTEIKKLDKEIWLDTDTLDETV